MKRLNLHTLASITFTALLMPMSAWSLEYKLTTSLPANQKSTVLAFFETAKQTLPENIKNAIGEVKVSIEDSKRVDIAGSASVFSRSIRLNKNLIPAILAGESNSQKTERMHGTVYREALATLIHETIHVYDLQNVHSKEEQDWIRRCNPVVTSEKKQQAVEKDLPDMCRYYKNMRLSFSSNPYYLMTAGFINDFNGYTQRSPDIYENTNSRESFAVNMEYFLLDKDFKCRRPTMYRLLSSQFEHIPFAGVNCETSLSYVVPGSQGSPAQMLKIDPSRVYQIHYLLADKGEAMMSGWGHAMIRLVICAPNTKFGPDCLLDLTEHVVLSYRAFVDSLSLNSMDGLTGKYPSRLFIIPLAQIIEEYTKDELRALKSIPLKLSRKEVEDVVTRSVESHWAYDGKYYFLSNNCATESMNLIRSAVFNADLLKVEVKTPIDLFDSLVRINRADNTVFKDMDKAARQSFYFRSAEGDYVKAFENLKKALNVREPDLKTYLTLKPQERRQYLAKITKDTPNAKAVVASALILENAMARRLEKRVMAGIQLLALNAFDQAEKNKGKAASIGANVKELANNYLELSQLFAKPSNFLKDEKGYGLPLSQESQDAEAKINEKAIRAENVEKEAKATIDGLISPADQAEIAATKENLKAISTLFRSIIAVAPLQQ